VAGLKTPWADRALQWAVESQAGKVASGEVRTDKAGLAALRFPVPKVRVAVRLALALRPADQPRGKGHLVELVVLPKDPFGDVRKSLEGLKIGLLPGGRLGDALKRSGLRHADLEKELVRGQFAGKVVVLSGLLSKSIKATGDYVRSLPGGTCLIVANDRLGKASAFALIDSLVAHKPGRQTRTIAPARSPIWADLPASWLGRGCPPHKLTEPRGLVWLRVLAGHVSPDGTIYPLAAEFEDVAGRRWLVWNPAEPVGPNDPRWGLLLRNSLLWAREQIAGWKKERSGDGGP